MKTTKDNRIHLGVFGRTNTGKSTFINALAGQDIAIVSDFAGTTTDPVKKSIEILGFGPVVLVDTPGIDDVTELGLQRISKTIEMLDIVDIAILLINDNIFDLNEINLIDEFKQRNTPFIIVANKSDITSVDNELKVKILNTYNKLIIKVSSSEIIGFGDVVEQLLMLKSELNLTNKSLFGGIISQGDFVLLVTPIDSEAPEGRMILPQVQAIRDVLDNDAIAIVLKETEVKHFFDSGKIKPKIVVTDSQAFGFINSIIPADVLLTGFSVLLARNKGDFEEYLKGTPKISDLKDGDKILLLESCTHTTSCEDIGRFKIPKWLRNYTGKELDFDVVAGLEKLKNPIENYALVIQCGGCVVTRKQLHNRLRTALDHEIPITNYGLAIAYMNGIFERAIQPFANLK